MAQIDDTLEERANWHWRNSARPVRFFALDARAAMPFCILLFYMRPISILLTVIITMMFHMFEKKGLTFPAAMRAMRVWLWGQYRPGWISLRKRRMIDYG